MGIRLYVDLSGAIISGYAAEEIHRYKLDLEDTLADIAVDTIRTYLPTQYMYLGNNGGDPRYNPVPPGAGELEESIHSRRVSDDYELVIGDDVIYGPWIEGVAVGNTFFWPGRVRRGLSPRFPGYHAFRLATQIVDNMAEEVAYAELPRYIEEINSY
jgi:hypothetical protein